MLSAELRIAWNQVITQMMDSQDLDLGGDPRARAFQRDPGVQRNPRARSLEWPSDPLQPAVCARRPNVQVCARELCDAGPRTRHRLHREYCEYAVIRSEGRPKRVEVTTELYEYWSCVAQHDPDLLRKIVADMLGAEPDWASLYGVDDPQARSREERKEAFRGQMVGGEDGPPADSLNARHALFMRSGINGLDDVVGIAMEGARLYAARVDDRFRPASWEEILAAMRRPDLACNHADPTILLGVHARAFDGEDVAFANPIGIYIQPPNLDVFGYEGRPLPPDWVRLERGHGNLHQRLVFGPPDEHEAFLDDIIVFSGSAEEPLVGGYQLLREIAVEVRLLAAPRAAEARIEMQSVPDGARATVCGSDNYCESIDELAAQLLRRPA